MKACPYCAEEIQDAAIKCKHCGEMLGQTQPSEGRYIRQTAPVSGNTANTNPVNGFHYVGSFFLIYGAYTLIGGYQTSASLRGTILEGNKVTSNYINSGWTCVAIGLGLAFVGSLASGRDKGVSQWQTTPTKRSQLTEAQQIAVKSREDAANYQLLRIFGFSLLIGGGVASVVCLVTHEPLHLIYGVVALLLGILCLLGSAQLAKR